MINLRETWARLLAFLRREALDRDFEEELAAHVEMATAEYVRQGLPLSEARRRALARLGGVTASKQLHRETRGLPWLEGLAFDLRHALRGLRRDWMFAAAVITMLTLALALNTTVFTVMDAMLFRGFPLVQDSHRLLFVQERSPRGLHGISYADFEDWRAQSQAFEALAFVGGSIIALRDDSNRASDLYARYVSADTFGLLGVAPALGRDFTPADEVAGTAPVIILSHRFWESRFSRRPDIVGSIAHVNGEPAAIIGVMPEEFEFPDRSSGLWLVLKRSPEMLRRGPAPGGYVAIGRLHEGVAREQARAELDAINLRLAAAYPDTNRGITPRMMAHAQFTSGPDAPTIWGSLWVGACYVLLIACGNVTNLSLARTVGRWRELSTMMALGAGTSRMVRQMLLESFALAGVAGALGWWLTKWSVRAWAEATASPYQTLDYAVNESTFTYLAGASLLAALLCALPPVVRIRRGGGATLKEHGRGVTHGRNAKRLSAGLVSGQMALAVVLLAATGVLMQSLMSIVGAETGVRDPDRVLVGMLRLPSERYPTSDARRRYVDRLEQQLTTIAGIEVASMSNGIPVKWSGQSRAAEIEGRPQLPEADESVIAMTASPNYFQVLGASLLSGRVFADSDRASSEPVAIVNQRFAETIWPGEQPLGKRLRFKDRDTTGPWLVVVGVVTNIMQGDPIRQQFKPLVYLPFLQEPTMRGTFFLARTSVPADQIASAVRTEVQSLDPDVSIERFETLETAFRFERDSMDSEHSELGKHASVAPVFAGLALLLAAAGLAAVIAHSVKQRTQEIGVRMAIGAAAHDIGRMILREGMRPVAIGLVGGLLASLAVNRLLQSQLVGVGPYDPVTMIGAPLLLIVVALLACRVPARRAMGVDPVVALRHE